MITETTAWLETIVDDEEQSWCPKCCRKPYTFYIEPESLFTKEHRCCSTCRTPLTAPED